MFNKTYFYFNSKLHDEKSQVQLQQVKNANETKKEKKACQLCLVS